MMVVNVFISDMENGGGKIIHNTFINLKIYKVGLVSDV